MGAIDGARGRAPHHLALGIFEIGHVFGTPQADVAAGSLGVVVKAVAVAHHPGVSLRMGLKKEGSEAMPTSKPSLPLFMPSVTEESSQTPLSMKADLPAMNSVVEEA